MSFQTEVADRVKHVPARRWLDYSRKFGQSSQDCMTDAVIAMVVIANEQHLRDHGAQDLERFLEMGMEELEAHLQAVLAPDEPPVEDAEFPDRAADGRPLRSGVVADGAGAGLRADAGADLPLDGDPAV